MTDTPPSFEAPADEDLTNIPDPNETSAMTGEVLPDDWTPNGNS